VLWMDLAVERMAHAVRAVTPGGQRRHEGRWLYFRHAMISAKTLRSIARGDRFFPSEDPESDAVWVRSSHSDFHAVEVEFQELVEPLTQAEIPSPSLDDALKNVTHIVNEVVGRPLVPLPGLACVLEVRRDFIIWLDQLNYAYEVRSLRVAKRAWKTAQRRHRKQKLMLAAQAARPPIG